MKKLGLIIVTVLFLFTSCKKDDSNSNIQSSTNLMPLGIGKHWKYRATAYAVENDTIIHHAQYTYDWKINKDTLINGELCFIIAKKDSVFSSGQVSLLNDYYKNTADGFFGVAASNGGGSGLAWLKQTEVANIDFMCPEKNGFTVLKRGLFFPPQPLQLLKYPVNLNDQWYSNEFGNSANVVRKYIGTESVTVPAGTFLCTHLQIYFYSTQGPTQTIDQYFSAGKGLIKVKNEWQSNDPSFTMVSTNIELLETN